jgi:hypothetical protein
MKKIVGLVVMLWLAILVGCNDVNHSPNEEITRAQGGSPTALTPAATVPKPESRWGVDIKVNGLDSKKLVVLSTSDIIIRCGSQHEGYIIPTLDNLGHMLEVEDHGQTVRYKFDDGKIQKGRWSVSTDYSALFLPQSVLQQLPKHKTLTVEYKPEYVVPKTESFDLTGLAEAENACPSARTK